MSKTHPTSPDPTDDPLDAASAAEAALERPAAPPTSEQVETWRARAEEATGLEDRLKRVQAEFVNENRRLQRQAEENRRYALEGIVKDLALVVESLEQALRAAAVGAASGAVVATGAGSQPGEAKVEQLRAGVALVLQKTEDLLRRHGAEVLRPVGQPFDPGAHEALVMVERSDLAPGLVADVVSPGMKLHGRVVKPAQVTVVRAPAAPPEPPDSGDAHASA